MAAMADEALSFEDMSEAELRQWVEANSGRVNDRDRRGHTPLVAAVLRLGGLSLLVWLLDEKGADVNATTTDGMSVLHYAASLAILNASLDRGADPTIADHDGRPPLSIHAVFGSADTVARLLQDPRVRATINMQDVNDETALHHACNNVEGDTAALKVNLLLRAGGDPTLIDSDGQTPVDLVRQFHPNHAAIALLEQALAEGEKTSLLVKARRLAVAANSTTVAPSCLQARVARGQPLPCIMLVPLTVGQDDGENDEEEGEQGRKLHTALAFICGLGREGMPRDVFRVVMDLLMPSWDPLRRKNTGAVPPQR